LQTETSLTVSSKWSLLKAGSLRYSGNEFQTDGPATEKARRAKELSSTVRPEVVGWSYMLQQVEKQSIRYRAPRSKK